MLNKEICLRCCQKVRATPQYMEVERETYVKIFNEDWEFHGQMWCEAQGNWIRIKGKARERKAKPGDVFYDAGSGLFDDTVNEQLMSACPYLVEHTVSHD